MPVLSIVQNLLIFPFMCVCLDGSCVCWPKRIDFSLSTVSVQLAIACAGQTTSTFFPPQCPCLHAPTFESRRTVSSTSRVIWDSWLGIARILDISSTQLSKLWRQSTSAECLLQTLFTPSKELLAIDHPYTLGKVFLAKWWIKPCCLRSTLCFGLEWFPFRIQYQSIWTVVW